MYTSFVYFALAGVFANASTAEHPLLHKNYSLARLQSVGAKKPLAVFIGSGEKGWEEISRDGQLDVYSRKVLSIDYVCVYVDTSKAEGKELAGAFDMTDGPGLVISNRDGSLQAFRHEGKLSSDDLSHYLRRYSDPDLVVQATQTKEPPPPVVVNYYQPPPVYYAPMNFGYFSGRSGGC